MSSKITIEPTEFVNVRSGKKTLGVRIYGDYFSIYDNNWESIPDDDMDILRDVKDMGNEFIDEMFDNIREFKCGVEIGGNWYDWDEIKDVVGGCDEDAE